MQLWKLHKVKVISQCWGIMSSKSLKNASCNIRFLFFIISLLFSFAGQPKRLGLWILWGRISSSLLRLFAIGLIPAIYSIWNSDISNSPLSQPAGDSILLSLTILLHYPLAHYDYFLKFQPAHMLLSSK